MIIFHQKTTRNEITKLEGGLVKAVLKKDLSVVEFANADKILEEFENRKNES